jgi:exopolysaccharide biosynthesis polyprenyl glycosylphosphotransferase
MTSTKRILLVLGDIIALGLAFAGMLVIRFGWNPEPGIIALHKTSIITLSIIWLIVLYVYNLYDAQFIKATLRSFRNIFLAIITCLGIGFILFYLVPFPVAPKTNLVISVGLFAFFLTLWRMGYSSIIAHNFKKVVVMVGTTEEMKRLATELERQKHLGYVIFGTFDSITEAFAACPQAEMIIYDKALQGTDLQTVVEADVDVVDVRDAYQEIFHLIPVTLIDDAFAVRMIEKNDNPLYKLTSRLVSIVFASIILLVTLPITFVFAMVIYLYDRGPIFFNHERVGYRGQVFKIFKLRSMVINAEKDGAAWAEDKDPRITPIGRIIRKTHIDEIPQMLNVLRGDISLVGPRPERPEFVDKLTNEIPYYYLRHSIRPGFTGWAQIKFRYARSVMDSQEKFEYDLYYIKNRNFVLDIGIIAKTIQIIFTH